MSIRRAAKAKRVEEDLRFRSRTMRIYDFFQTLPAAPVILCLSKVHVRDGGENKEEKEHQQGGDSRLVNVKGAASDSPLVVPVEYEASEIKTKSSLLSGFARTRSILHYVSLAIFASLVMTTVSAAPLRQSTPSIGGSQPPAQSVSNPRVNVASASQTSSPLVNRSSSVQSRVVPGTASRAPPHAPIALTSLVEAVLAAARCNSFRSDVLQALETMISCVTRDIGTDLDLADRPFWTRTGPKTRIKMEHFDGNGHIRKGSFTGAGEVAVPHEILPLLSLYLKERPINLVIDGSRPTTYQLSRRQLAGDTVAKLEIAGSILPLSSSTDVTPIDIYLTSYSPSLFGAYSTTPPVGFLLESNANYDANSSVPNPSWLVDNSRSAPTNASLTQMRKWMKELRKLVKQFFEKSKSHDGLLQEGELDLSSVRNKNGTYVKKGDCDCDEEWRVVEYMEQIAEELETRSAQLEMAYLERDEEFRQRHEAQQVKLAVAGVMEQRWSEEREAKDAKIAGYEVIVGNLRNQVEQLSSAKGILPRIDEFDSPLNHVPPDFEATSAPTINSIARVVLGFLGHKVVEPSSSPVVKGKNEDQDASKDSNLDSSTKRQQTGESKTKPTPQSSTSKSKSGPSVPKSSSSSSSSNSTTRLEDLAPGYNADFERDPTAWLMNGLDRKKSLPSISWDDLKTFFTRGIDGPFWLVRDRSSLVGFRMVTGEVLVEENDGSNPLLGSNFSFQCSDDPQEALFCDIVGTLVNKRVDRIVMPVYAMSQKVAEIMFNSDFFKPWSLRRLDNSETSRWHFVIARSEAPMLAKVLEAANLWHHDICRTAQIARIAQDPSLHPYVPGEDFFTYSVVDHTGSAVTKDHFKRILYSLVKSQAIGVLEGSANPSVVGMGFNKFIVNNPSRIESTESLGHFVLPAGSRLCQQLLNQLSRLVFYKRLSGNLLPHDFVSIRTDPLDEVQRQLNRESMTKLHKAHATGGNQRTRDRLQRQQAVVASSNLLPTPPSLPQLESTGTKSDLKVNEPVSHSNPVKAHVQKLVSEMGSAHPSIGDKGTIVCAHCRRSWSHTWSVANDKKGQVSHRTLGTSCKTARKILLGCTAYWLSGEKENEAMELDRLLESIASTFSLNGKEVVSYRWVYNWQESLTEDLHGYKAIEASLKRYHSTRPGLEPYLETILVDHQRRGSILGTALGPLVFENKYDTVLATDGSRVRHGCQVELAKWLLSRQGEKLEEEDEVSGEDLLGEGEDGDGTFMGQMELN
ncbi:hypothetical protein JCM5353_001260 [Sporobolomyces roseus]